MIIKIIDWISRIMAVVITIGSSFVAISGMIMKLSTKIGMIELGSRNAIVISIGMVIMVIFCLALQAGLFLAPAVRGKKIIYRLGVAILLMLPTTSIFFSIVVGISKMKILKGIPLNIAEIIMFIVCSIGLIVYITQYYLLFKSKKVTANSHHTYISHLEHDTIFKPPILEKPLCVITYSWWGICGGIFAIMSIGACFLLMIAPLFIGSITSWDLKIWLILGVILMVAGGIWGIIELLLFKDVKLYRNRIVKSWYLLGQKEVKLEEAYISKYGGVVGGIVKIYLKKRQLGLKDGIFFIEDLVKRKNMREFYNILAELSGRDVKDLSERKIKSFKYHLWTQKLIKGVINNGNINNFKG